MLSLHCTAANMIARHHCAGALLCSINGQMKGWHCFLRPLQLPVLCRIIAQLPRMYRDERDQKTADIYRAMRRGDYQLSDKLKKEVSHLLC